jgi:hypothetical protein
MDVLTGLLALAGRAGEWEPQWEPRYDLSSHLMLLPHSSISTWLLPLIPPGILGPPIWLHYRAVDWGVWLHRGL